MSSEDPERAQIRLQWLSVAAGEAVVAALIVSLPWHEAPVRVLLAAVTATVAAATAVAALRNPQHFHLDEDESTNGPSIPRPMFLGILTVAVLLCFTLILWAAG